MPVAVTPNEYSQSVNTVTIANGESLSDSVGLSADTLVAISMPADWTAADLTFQGSHDDVTYNNLYSDTGTEVTVTAADDRFIVLDPTVFCGVRYLKVRSGTAASPVAQGADRALVLIGRPV